MMQLFKHKLKNRYLWCDLYECDFNPIQPFEETKFVKVIAIIYPKGKRPDLLYPQNKKK
jgi:hypothetical protein